jgi:hypothetical protein
VVEHKKIKGTKEPQNAVPFARINAFFAGVHRTDRIAVVATLHKLHTQDVRSCGATPTHSVAVTWPLWLKMKIDVEG